MTATALLVVGQFFLLLTISSSIAAARSRRDRHRLDVVLFLVCLELILWFPQGSSLGAIIKSGLIALLPYAALRLVRHFRDVPAWLLGASLFAGAAAMIAAGLWPQEHSPASVATPAYVSALLTYAAGAMALEARRSSGVKARRLRYAASGTALFALSFGGATTAVVAGSLGIALGKFLNLINGAAIICYYLAFSPPRPLLTKWRRAEQANYLATAAAREPEERGRRAADDLFQAAVRSAGGAVTLVAMRVVETSDELVVSAATEPTLVGTTLGHDTGLIAQGFLNNVAVSGPPGQVHRTLSATLQSRGVQALVAPVAGTAQVWGVVVVVHRRGALFPSDDLLMLAQLGRDAATALDHAHLIEERREQARRAADRRLREVESLVGLMLDSIKDYAMLVIDADGRVAAWQLGAQHLFGHRRDQIADQNAALMYDLTPAEFSMWLAEARATGRADREGRCRRRDGSTFLGTTLITPLANESGEPPGFVAVTRDVTERRGLEEQLRQSQKMEAIGQLAGGIAHDFNNLLTAILGYASFLEEGLKGDPLRDNVVEISKAAERAADLTRQLLAFSRRNMLQPTDVDLAPLVADLVPMLRRLIVPNVEIIDATVPALPMVWGNRSQIEQVVLNLVVNARDAMPDGGRITIRTATVLLAERNDRSGMAAGAYVLLEVSDTGTGMDAETKRRVFEPFFTTKDVGKGTGLGLSTVYGIVQEMGGTVEIESELRRGTTFRLYFPEATHAASNPSAHDIRRGGETLLLVEDDEASRAYLRGVLERYGYEVIAADHPRSAVALTKSFGRPVDLVISDVVMPGSSGSELVQLLGRQRAGVAALYIFESSDGIPMREPARGHQFLRQSLSPTALLARIRRILAAA